MKKLLISFCLSTGFFLVSTSSYALTDTYFATGEDLDYLIESDNTLAIREIEYELRKFVFFRNMEDFIMNLNLQAIDD